MLQRLLSCSSSATRLQQTWPSLSRCYNKKAKPKADKTMQAAAEALASRGFLRPVSPYSPPNDLEDKLQKICAESGFNETDSLDSPEKKFIILKSCFEEFDHGVPNSMLPSIETIDDIKEFYKTPVDTTTPFDALKKMDLPKNLYVQQDYVRFHPEKDTMFNGVSAFPKSSTIVSGLKTKKKYDGYEAKRSWP